jgi:L-2-hydroxyglutarate oxidase LhgO
MIPMERADVVVIGAGVVGLAAARSLAMAGHQVFVADSESYIGSGTSSRNSGVIHAGIYYKKNSYKARFCVDGKNRLYHYLNHHNIAYKNCTKLIVATNNDELSKLEFIRVKALENGVNDLTLISGAHAKEIEPELSCVGALCSPSTSIIDVHEYLHSLVSDIEKYDGIIALHNKVHNGKVTSNGIVLKINDAEILAKTVINAAGIGAQSIAHKIEGLASDTIPTQFLAKGNYFTISGKAPFSRLIYPVPVSGGLGAHFTINMAGESLFGPDVEWIENSDYDELNYFVSSERTEKFYGYIERYYPAIREKALRPAYAGIRPKVSSAGQQDGDFVIQGPKQHGVKGLINLYGIESPGLTSSMAIAEHIKIISEQQS